VVERRHAQRCLAADRRGERLALHPAESSINLFGVITDRQQFFDQVVFRDHVAVVEEILGDEADNRQDPFSHLDSVELLITAD